LAATRCAASETMKISVLITGEHVSNVLWHGPYQTTCPQIFLVTVGTFLLLQDLRLLWQWRFKSRPQLGFLFLVCLLNF
jgi:hypothetical protein